MELYCPKCGEPTDNDEFHERADEIGSSYNKVTLDFRSNGCSALGGKCGTPLPAEKSEMISAIYDLLGGDMDGAASTFEDMEFIMGEEF